MGGLDARKLRFMKIPMTKGFAVTGGSSKPFHALTATTDFHWHMESNLMNSIGTKGSASFFRLACARALNSKVDYLHITKAHKTIVESTAALSYLITLSLGELSLRTCST